jgi:hypothetical protein
MHELTEHIARVRKILLHIHDASMGASRHLEDRGTTREILETFYKGKQETY